jgi:hypothetical protein
VPGEQNVCEEGVAVATGLGLTVITTTIGVPLQPPATGVIVYVAVPGEVPVAVSVCAMLDPLAADAPLTPLWDTVQEKVVPPILLVKEIAVALPEHIV